MDRSSLFLKLNDQLYDLSTPIVMGILNVTPDSFFMASRLRSDRTLLHQAEKMLTEGASILDVGGYSTRPQAALVSIDEEKERVGDALEMIRKRFPKAILSVDTFRSSVARMAVEDYDVAMINDVGGGLLDPQMFETVAALGKAYVLMHTRGTPQTMQQMTQYDALIPELLQYLEKRVAQLRLLGVNDIIIDPGFGFAKTMEQNYEILRYLSYFQHIDVPVLAGVSRKSMIQKLLKVDADKALNGTTAVHMLALVGGASILRVHDVKEASEAIKVFTAWRGTNNEFQPTQQ